VGNMSRRLFSKIIFLLILSVLIIFVYHVKASERSNAIVVDASNVIEKMPSIYRAGTFGFRGTSGWSHSSEYLHEKFFRNQKIGAIEIDMPWDTILPSKNIDDMLARLSKWDEIVKKISSNGADVIVPIYFMPVWLTSNLSTKSLGPGLSSETVSSTSPPKDYEIWAKLVELIVDHFNNKLKINAKYKIWWEPDIPCWQGTEEEYFKLYKYSVLGAKRANINAKIGGPSLARWFSKKEVGKEKMPMMYNFIKYCSTNSIEPLGIKRLPIDFIIWHQFNANPFNPYSYSEPNKLIRKWLKELGYDENTPILIGEGNTWQESGKLHPYLSPEHDTEFAASYLIATLYAMDSAKIQGYSFTYFQDWIGGGEFNGDFGLFTKHDITKPVYNAFNAVSMLQTDRLQVTTKGNFLTAIATKDDGKMSLLISNFIPVGPMADLDINRVFQVFLAKGYVKELKEAGFTKETIRKKVKDLTSGKESVENSNMPDDFKKELKNALNVISDLNNMASESANRISGDAQVEIKIKNIPFKEEIRYERYLIDLSHSNSYSIRDKVVNAIKKAEMESFNEAERYLLEKGFTEGEVQKMKKMYGEKRNLQEMLQTYPQSKKIHIHKARDIMEESFIRKTAAINEWPEVRLQKVEEKDLGIKKDFVEIRNLPPYSVMLIIISKK
jgi:hypothetical protein